VYRFADVVKNKNSFILAWRPLNAINNRFELCLYENIDGANVPHDSAIYQVSGGQLFDFELVYTNNKYSLYVDGNLLGTQRNDVTYNWIAKISAWFGGNQSAPWTMWLEMDF
jgi:aromatic ring-cleaving dioxygenase